MTVAVSEDDFSLRAVTGGALALLGKEALPKIREWLESKEIKVLETSVLAALEIGESAKPALPDPMQQSNAEAIRKIEGLE